MVSTDEVISSINKHIISYNKRNKLKNKGSGRSMVIQQNIKPGEFSQMK